MDRAAVCSHIVNGGDSDVRGVMAVTALRAAEAAEVSVNMIVIFVVRAAFGALAGVGQVYSSALSTRTEPGLRLTPLRISARVFSTLPNLSA